MNSREEKIKELLSSKNPSASDVTKPLKFIGDGDMKKGVDTIFDYGKHVGEKSGKKKGSLETLGVIGVAYLVFKGGKYVGEKIKESKLHKLQEDKIIEAFEDETISVKDEEVGDDWERARMH